VPFYNLPKLHALMAAETRFGRDATVAHGIAAALRPCAASPGAVAPARGAAAE
jgi:hypothetical protein